jgi:uncharacterized membrane protein YdbT with pleckstrin-like domain
MSYFESAKLENEKIIMADSISKSLLKFVLVIGLLIALGGLISVFTGGSIIFLLFGFIILSYIIILRHSIEYVITDKRLLIKTGILNIQSVEINISKIESISVSQTILGRILNYGNLQISGAGNPLVKLEYVDSPLMFKKKCLEQSSKEVK